MRIADTLEALADAIRDLAVSAEGADDGAVEALWNRLGLESQKFLYELAVDFTPDGGPFDLEQVGKRLGLDPGSARSRLMTIGRSARALGASAPRLWTAELAPATRRKRYTWNPAAHAAVMRLVEG